MGTLEMAMTVIKVGDSTVRRHLCMVDGEAAEARLVKRRRRETVAAALGDHQPPQQQESDSISAPTTVKRSSRFRGNSSGAYDDEEAAARAYDLAALKYWGTSTCTNFPISDYEKEIEVMETITKEEYLASLRRHHHNGRWEARIGRVFGNKYLYLGTYSTQEEAARAYDIAAIEYRGINAITNFDLSNYIRWLKPGATVSVPSQEAEPKTELQKALAVVNRSKQEQHRRNVLFGLCRKPSSPTALGLLLRSSVFKELVEKNSILKPEQENSNDEYGGLCYDTPFCALF
ncbi:UNVERIFIED_CONTAM: Ethylene-responsive transcription factor WRI1 [Sesamum radiatum]|uniref:Ethylene-responsive transcription factor WRI1 n=1 Tax=Sesamum radiatum TaxID=300843 RepID=A0AAW2VQA6_SESRA